MIVKPFAKDKLTKGLEALKNRLPITHEKYSKIEDDLSMHDAGNYGEQHVLSFLANSRLPEHAYLLHNVKFTAKVDVQIDILLLTPHWSLIIEVKNIKGNLYFKSSPRQLIRMNQDRTEDILGMPESQVEKYRFGLQILLQEHGIQLPIYKVIHFPFNNANIQKMPETTPLLIGYELTQYIWSLPKAENPVDPKQVVQLLMKHQTETDDRFPLCEHYGIAPKDIIRGVECPECGKLPMTRLQRTWQCPFCKKTNNTAHVKALEDYAILISNTVGSTEIMEFLKLRNRFEARRILKAHSVTKTGKTKASRYVLKY